MKDIVVNAINEAMLVLYGLKIPDATTLTIIELIDSDEDRYELIDKIDCILNIKLSNEDTDVLITFDDIINKSIELLKLN